MDATIELQRQINALARDIERLRTIEKRSNVLPFAGYAATGGVGLTANDTMMAVSMSRLLVVLSWTQTIYVATTNDGSNYWTIQIDDNVTAFASFTTAAIAPNTWSTSNITSFTQPTAAPTSGWILIRCVKTGAPGRLFWTNAEVRTA